MDEHVLHTYLRRPEVFVSGRGATLVADDGREWVDLFGGVAVSALGHAHPALVAALRDQVGKVLHVSNLYRHPYTEDVAGRLARLTGMEAAFFANSGAEANECALKLARKHQRDAGRTERTGFVALEGSFHGRTLGALTVTHAARYREPFAPLAGEARFVPPGDADALERALEGAPPAALILEPIQGESGVKPLPLEFLRTARDLCTVTNTVLIHDEVQSGCGRTGDFLAGDAAGVKPDLVTLAKPLGAGVPIGACLASAALAGAFEPGDHGSTFGGGPLALRAALVFLEEWEERGLATAARAAGASLEARLDALAGDFDCVRERRGRGLMQALVLDRPAAPVAAAAFERGAVVGTAGADVLRLVPPFVITEAELDRGLGALADVLGSL